MSALGLGGIEQLNRERRERHSVLAPFLHLGCRNREHITVDPVPPQLRRFARTKHRHELKREEDLHPPRSFSHDAHGIRKVLPLDGRHRRHDGSGEDTGNSIHWVVRDVSRADSEVENFAAPHQHPLQSRLLACLFEWPNDVDEKRGRDLVQWPRSHEWHQVEFDHPTLGSV